MKEQEGRRCSVYLCRASLCLSVSNARRVGPGGASATPATLPLAVHLPAWLFAPVLPTRLGIAVQIPLSSLFSVYSTTFRPPPRQFGRFCDMAGQLNDMAFAILNS